MRSVPLVGAAVLATLALAPAAASAAPCVQVGVYQDDPGHGMPALQEQVGKGVAAISTYLTAGQAAVAEPRSRRRTRTARSLVVTWQPDARPRRLQAAEVPAVGVAKGKYDTLAAGARPAAARRPQGRRPAPDAGDEHALVPVVGHGEQEHARPTTRRRGSACARRSARRKGGKRSSCCGRPTRAASPTPARTRCAPTSPAPPRSTSSAPTPTTSAPGRRCCGASPARSSATAYTTIEALAPKPFWLAETGSAAPGGDKAGWITTLVHAAGHLDAQARGRRLVRRQGRVRGLPPAHQPGHQRVQLAAEGSVSHESPRQQAAARRASGRRGKPRRHRLQLPGAPGIDEGDRPVAR